MQFHQIFSHHQEFGQNKLDFSAILNGLKNEDESYDSAVQLSEYLSFSNADNLAHGSFAHYLPLFLESFAHILSTSNNHELSVVVIQCLNNLLDALPAVAKLFRSNGLMTAICQKFIPEEFDLFEDLINIMHKVSQEKPEGLFEAGVLSAIFSCDLNFFEKSLLTKVSTIACNICKYLPPTAFAVILPIIGKISELIHNQDAIIQEKALLCFYSIAQSFCHKNKEFMLLLSEDLVEGIVQSLQDPTISNTQESCSIKTLTLISRSPQYLKFLMNSNLCNCLEVLLRKNTAGITNVIQLVQNMLPNLPNEIDIFRSPHSKENFQMDLFKEEPELLLKFATSGLFNSLIHLFSRTNGGVKFLLLDCLTKIIYASTNHTLLPFLEKSPLFNLISQLFTEKDNKVNAVGVSLVKLCMERQAQFCKDFFVRNGVVEKLNNISLLYKVEMNEDMPVEPKPAQIHIIPQNIQKEEEEEKRNRYPLRSKANTPAPSKKRNNNINANVEEAQPLTLEPVTKKRKKEKKIILSPHEALLQKSREITNQYFSGIQLETPEYIKLKSIVKTLESGEETSKENAVKELFSILESISSYETNKSGVMVALNKYFYMNQINYLVDQQVLSSRLSVFSSLLFGSVSVGPTQKRTHSLIQLLKQLLEEEQELPIFISSFNTPQIVQHLIQTRQIRIKIVKDESIKGDLPGFEENEYDVEPLATVARIKEEITNFLNRSESNNDSTSFKNNSSVNQPAKETAPTRSQTFSRELDMEYLSDDDEEIEREYLDNEEIDDDQVNEMENPFNHIPHSHKISLDNPASKPPSLTNGDMIALSYNGVVLDDDITLVSAIQNANKNAGQLSDISVHSWRQKHQFTIHIAERKNQKKEDIFISDSPIPMLSRIISSKDWDESVFLNLLWLINALYEAQSVDSKNELISSKMTSKLDQQLQDANSVCCLSFPYWCKNIIQNYPFLTSLETRITYFKDISFGLLRSLYHLSPIIQIQSHHGHGHAHTRQMRIPRQKVRIHREKLFESSFQVLEICAKKRHYLLDVEYFGEIGVGLGPTKEFYTLLSYQFQMESKAMFLSGESGHTIDVQNNVILVHNESGLYPRPFLMEDTRNKQQILNNFRCLGMFVAKALMDDRFLDMKFSRVFYKLLLKERMTLQDLQELSPSFGSVIIEFQKIIDQKNAILQNTTKSDIQKRNEINQLRYEGGSIENLHLTFRIAEGLLKEGGDDCDLNIDNLEEYVRLVYDSFFGSGVQLMIESFKEGFTRFFPIENLKCFSHSELDVVICGVSEAKYWLKTELLAMPFELANGFNANSNAILMLIDVLAELTHERQRKFLTFLTGSPRLPIGGFKNLKPLIKISRKESSNNNSDLPSANTCFNHLKLPNYSQVAILREKIIFAIENGSNSFDLS